MAEGRDYSNYEILLRWSLGNQLAQMGKNKQATEINQRLVLVKMVGLPGLEPGMTESKSGVLPLHYRPNVVFAASRLRANNYAQMAVDATINCMQLGVFFRLSWRPRFKRLPRFL